MKKKVKKVGQSIAITFTKEEQEIYNIKVGATYDIEIVKLKGDKEKYETY